jgi:hypothetical protein
VETFTAAGLMSQPARYFWRKAGLIDAPAAGPAA